jgi:hypothetical protein
MPYDIGAGTIGDRLRIIKPTLFLGVPRVWEKVQAKIKGMSASAPPVTGLKLKIKTNALASGLKHQEDSQLGGSGAKACCYGLYEKKVHNVVKGALCIADHGVCGVRCAVCSVQCAVCGVWRAVCGVCGVCHLSCHVLRVTCRV